MRHTEESELAGQVFKLTGVKHNVEGDGPHEFEVIDWWDRLTGKSWMFSDNNPAALWYAMRGAMKEPPTPLDDEVLYGHLQPSGLGILVHISEIP